MATGLVNNAITNKIEWATHNGKGFITGKRKDVTDEAIKIMFSHMMNAYERHDRAVEMGYFSYSIEGIGELRFIPSDEKVINKD